VVTLAVLVVFWNIWILPGALLIPVLAWTGFLTVRNLAWWRHGRQLGPVEPQAVPTTRQAA